MSFGLMQDLIYVHVYKLIICLFVLFNVSGFLPTPIKFCGILRLLIKISCVRNSYSMIQS